VSDEFIYPEGINSEVLKKIFEEFFMEVSEDTDGDLIVQDTHRCYLRPDPDGRLILIYAIFGASPGVVPADKVDYVNHVNDQSRPTGSSTSTTTCRSKAESRSGRS
jgi:hypothetical protein